MFVLKKIFRDVTSALLKMKSVINQCCKLFVRYLRTTFLITQSIPTISVPKCTNQFRFSVNFLGFTQLYQGKVPVSVLSLTRRVNGRYRHIVRVIYCLICFAECETASRWSDDLNKREPKGDGSLSVIPSGVDD